MQQNYVNVGFSLSPESEERAAMHAAQVEGGGILIRTSALFWFVVERREVGRHRRKSSTSYAEWNCVVVVVSPFLLCYESRSLSLLIVLRFETLLRLRLRGLSHSVHAHQSIFGVLALLAGGRGRPVGRE